MLAKMKHDITIKINFKGTYSHWRKSNLIPYLEPYK